jgi:hypothetical protein
MLTEHDLNMRITETIAELKQRGLTPRKKKKIT